MNAGAFIDTALTLLAAVIGLAWFINRRRAPRLDPQKFSLETAFKAPEPDLSRVRLFTPGARYRVKRGFLAHPLAFETGEALTFENAAYSRDDNCHVYDFASETGVKKKSYWLSDEDPPESWQRYFEPL
jgi:hypothetical protein